MIQITSKARPHPAASSPPPRPSPSTPLRPPPGRRGPRPGLRRSNRPRPGAFFHGDPPGGGEGSPGHFMVWFHGDVMVISLGKNGDFTANMVVFSGFCSGKMDEHGNFTKEFGFHGISPAKFGKPSQKGFGWNFTSDRCGFIRRPMSRSRGPGGPDGDSPPNLGSYEVVFEFDSVQLVPRTPKTMVYGWYIYSSWGL